MAGRRVTPFLKVAGTALFRPPAAALAQTDGSWHQCWRLSRTAALLRTGEGEIWKSVQTYTAGEHASSTDSEWASVVDGILLAIKRDQGVLELENDNLGVMQAITGKGPRPRSVFGREALDAVYELTTPFEWFAARWIPRGRNGADRLFRVQPPRGPGPYPYQN